MVTTVAGSILENAGTGNDLLNKIPGVSANEGDIKVFGAELLKYISTAVK